MQNAKSELVKKKIGLTCTGEDLLEELGDDVAATRLDSGEFIVSSSESKFLYFVLFASKMKREKFSV